MSELIHLREPSASAGASKPADVIAASAHDVFRGTAFFASLDGLRCLAILAVIWVHTGIRVEGITLTQRGYLGVDLFFAISGFLITTLLLRERERHGSISLGAFYMRRSLRIFPLYYTVVAFYAVFVWALEPATPTGRQFFANLPYFLTYTSNWFVPLEGRVIFYFAWSLATEEQFYLVWPSLEKLLRGWRVLWAIAGLLVLRTVVAYAVHGGMLAADPLWVRMVLSIHPAILGGVVLAHLLHDRQTFAFVAPLLASRWTAPAILIALFAAIEAGLPLAVIWLLMVALVGAVVIRESNGLAPFLRWRPVAHIGLVSYGMYLFHMLSYHAVKRLLAVAGLEQSWLWFPATVIVATLVATLSFRYYESWFLHLKSRYARINSRRAVDLQMDLGSSAQSLSAPTKAADAN
jgi:peptidoglycan/LPS O-acetylase OafA/YrhL